MDIEERVMAGSATGFNFGAGELSSRELNWADSRERCAQEHTGDVELASALRRGDDAAYELLLRRYEEPIHNLIYRLLHRPADSEDVTQEVFLKVFRSIGSFRGDSSLKTWMYRIAVNEARNHLRKCARRNGHEVGLDDEATEGLTWEQVIEDRHSSPFESLVSVKTHEAIEAALREVKPVFREAVVLRDVEELSYSEIAAILGENLATVKTRILRGRRSLRELLQGEQGQAHGTASHAVPVER
jgi:RNA polymerase sigma-70 factor (ECF subfamily)